MRHGIWIALSLLVAVPQSASAQAQLTDTQKLGERLFEQSCGICHTKPTLVSGQYGPVLSKESGGGREDVIRGVITNGTPRMPAFKYTYDPTQIAAIAAYLETMPVPPAEPAAAKPQGVPQRDDN